MCSDLDCSTIGTYACILSLSVCVCVCPFGAQNPALTCYLVNGCLEESFSSCSEEKRECIRGDACVSSTTTQTVLGTLYHIRHFCLSIYAIFFDRVTIFNLSVTTTTKYTQTAAFCSKKVNLSKDERCVKSNWQSRRPV